MAIQQAIRADFLHGNLNTAHQKAEQASTTFATNPDWAIRFQLIDAEILTYQGRRPAVLALLNSTGFAYPTTGDFAIKRNLLCAMAHAKLGQSQQADEELQQARHLTDTGRSQLRGELLQAQASIENYRDHLPEAAALFKASLNIAREQRDSFLEASDLSNLGFMALKMGHYDEALAWLNESATIATKIQARPVIEATLGNVGSAYFYLGDFEKALSSFQQAEQEAKEIGTTSAQVDWLWAAGSSYYNLGNVQKAAECYQESLRGALVIQAPEEIAALRMQLGYLLYKEGRYDAAKTQSDEAIRVARTSGDKPGELWSSLLQALLATRQAKAQDAERMLLQVHRDSADIPSARWEIENALAALSAEQQKPRQAEMWYRRSILTFEGQRKAIKDVELRLPFFANGDVLYRDYANFLIASHRQEQALQWLDLGRAKTLAESLDRAKQQSAPQTQTVVAANSVARKLDGTILFYSLGPLQSCLWVVTPNRTRLFLLPGQSSIELQVRGYQKAILRSSDPLRDANETAKALFETLVAPAAAMIPKGSRVFIIPDGVLNALNFETLLTAGATPHYWIEDVTIANANSIGLLSAPDGGSSNGYAKKLLLIGNPVGNGTGYESLVNAFAESRGIEKQFSPDRRTVVTQSEAIPAAYAQNNPDRFEYIHFVAHGTASRMSPLDSAVVLSAPPGSPDSFKLYARDIMRFPLHAKLVTISACYGAGLRAYAGEGLVGLSWAFLHAGAHNVIGALWEVNDASTPILMDRLYAELEAGRSPEAALRAAKLSLIHSKAVYRKPLYWAAFQLYTGS